MNDRAILPPERCEALTAHLRALLARGLLPHAHVLAIVDGEIAYEAIMGQAREDGRPLERDAIYRIASMTKPVTSVAAMMLAEEGALSLDDPVARYLPELGALRVHAAGDTPPFATCPASRQPTIADLLSHVAGFSYGLQQRSPVDRAYRAAGLLDYMQPVGQAEFLDRLAALPLLHDPGVSFTYSVSTDVLGLIVERVSGMTLGAFFTQRIFAPLGMIDTGFVVPSVALDRLTDAWAMQPGRGSFLYDRASESLWLSQPKWESGGGGLVSTMADCARFCRMLADGGTLGEVRLLSPASVAAMMRNHLPGNASLGAFSQALFSGPRYTRTGFGLGLGVTLAGGDGALPEGAAHWSGLFSTWFALVPERRLILLCMSQMLHPVDNRLGHAMRQILLAP